MLSNWNRSHTLILIMIVGLAGLLYFFGGRMFLQPLQDDLDSAAEEIDLYQRQLDELTEEAQEADDELNQIVKQVPKDKSPDAVVNELKTMADRSEVDVESIASASGESADESEEDRQLGEVSYSLEISGSTLNHVHTFLEAVKSSQPFMRIDSLSIEQSGSADVTMNITTFYSNT